MKEDNYDWKMQKPDKGMYEQRISIKITKTVGEKKKDGGRKRLDYIQDKIIEEK